MDELLEPIYFDNAAATRCCGEAAQRVMQALTHDYANPSSLHGMGLQAQKLVECAQREIAGAVGADAGEICFTSGATESNNLALLGAARALRRRGRRILAAKGEHSSVSSCMQALREEGFEVVEVAPDSTGTVRADDFAAQAADGTILVSCMMANNETGAVNDIGSIFSAVRSRCPQAVTHCDAVQALGKLPIRLKRLPVDLMTFSSHKIYGPKGAGALYVRKGVRVAPLLNGGGQQGGIRPGTENVPGIYGFGLAAALAAQRLAQRLETVRGLHGRMIEKLRGIPDVCINSPANATPYILNLSVCGIRSETMLHFLAQNGIYVSSGSACSRGAKSPALQAMGLSPQRVDSALRVSFCAENTAEEVDAAAQCIEQGVKTLARRR